MDLFTLILEKLLVGLKNDLINYLKNRNTLFDRIVAKGKSKKLALIAVCNKLLKQAFSIVKNGVPYNKEYRSALVVN